MLYDVFCLLIGYLAGRRFPRLLDWPRAVLHRWTAPREPWPMTVARLRELAAPNCIVLKLGDATHMVKHGVTDPTWEELQQAIDDCRRAR